VLTEKYLIEEDPTSNDFVVTNTMLMAAINEEEDEPMTEPTNEGPTTTPDATTDAQPHTSPPSTPNQGLTNTTGKKTIRAKRRKMDNIAPLHEHLQGIIIPNFTPVNEQTGRDDLNEKAPGSC
jgi:hypothetical protein